MKQISFQQLCEAVAGERRIAKTVW